MRTHLVGLGLLGCLTSVSAAALTLSGGYRGGILHSGAPVHGLGVGLRVLPKLSLAYSYTYASLDVKNEVGLDANFWGTYHGTSDFDVKQATVRRGSQEIQARLHPASGSFFFAFGLMRHGGEAKLNVRDRNDGSTLERKYEFDGTMASIGIGNIWDQNTIMFGFEWAGFTRLLDYSSETSSTLVESTSANALEAESSFKDAMRWYAGRGSLTLLMFHFGVAI
jgi:hypothetical protein